MTKIKDNCVLITGGASGIGRIMGRMALEKGARHRKEQKLQGTAVQFPLYTPLSGSAPLSVV